MNAEPKKALTAIEELLASECAQGRFHMLQLDRDLHQLNAEGIPDPDPMTAKAMEKWQFNPSFPVSVFCEDTVDPTVRLTMTFCREPVLWIDEHMHANSQTYHATAATGLTEQAVDRLRHILATHIKGYRAFLAEAQRLSAERTAPEPSPSETRSKQTIPAL